MLLRQHRQPKLCRAFSQNKWSKFSHLTFPCPFRVQLTIRGQCWTTLVNPLISANLLYVHYCQNFSAIFLSLRAAPRFLGRTRLASFSRRRTQTPETADRMCPLSALALGGKIWRHCAGLWSGNGFSLSFTCASSRRVSFRPSFETERVTSGISRHADVSSSIGHVLLVSRGLGGEWDSKSPDLTKHSSGPEKTLLVLLKLLFIYLFYFILFFTFR